MPHPLHMFYGNLAQLDKKSNSVIKVLISNGRKLIIEVLIVLRWAISALGTLVWYFWSWTMEVWLCKPIFPTRTVECTVQIWFMVFMRKGKRSDSVLWQKPIDQQKRQKGKVTTQTTPQKSSITQRLRTDLGRSVGVTTAAELVWLTWFMGPTFQLPATAV